METKENVETKLVKEPKKAKRFSGIGIKLIFITVVIIGLLIGLSFIKGQLSDREYSYREAKYQISESAGGKLNLSGPYIAIPYVKTIDEFVYKDNKQFKETKIIEGWEIISADYVNIETYLDAEVRPVGIYSSPIFTGDAGIAANFNIKPLNNKSNIDYNPEKAVVYIPIRNSSLTSSPVFTINGKNYETDLVRINELWGVGVTLPVSYEKLNLTTNIGIRGADQFSYYISSKDTKLSLKSDWTAPGFTGFSYLPDKRTIDENGFSAEWNIHFGTTDISQYIGTSFIEPVNLYQKLHRATKYGFLFIIVPFIVIFLFEVFAKITLHPVNYLLSGAACVLFFLLLLGLSEHIPFDASYIIGAIAAGITVSLYIASVTKKYALGIIMAGMFVLLYGYLFLSLKSEDYALLIGSVFAFAILAMLMFCTRKIDWYSIKASQKNEAPALQSKL